MWILSDRKCWWNKCQSEKCTIRFFFLRECLSREQVAVTFEQHDLKKNKKTCESHNFIEKIVIKILTKQLHTKIIKRGSGYIWYSVQMNVFFFCWPSCKYWSQEASFEHVKRVFIPPCFPTVLYWFVRSCKRTTHWIVKTALKTWVLRKCYCLYVT